MKTILDAMTWQAVVWIFMIVVIVSIMVKPRGHDR
jgi:hypothetical protein